MNRSLISLSFCCDGRLLPQLVCQLRASTGHIYFHDTTADENETKFGVPINTDDAY